MYERSQPKTLFITRCDEFNLEQGPRGFTQLLLCLWKPLNSGLVKEATSLLLCKCM